MNVGQTGSVLCVFSWRKIGDYYYNLESSSGYKVSINELESLDKIFDALKGMSIKQAKTILEITSHCLFKSADAQDVNMENATY